VEYRSGWSYSFWYSCIANFADAKGIEFR
jgi:hypothetical protein